MGAYTVQFGESGKASDYNLVFSNAGKTVLDLGKDRGFSEVLNSILGNMNSKMGSMVSVNIKRLAQETGEKVINKAYYEFGKLIEEALYKVMPELFMKVVRQKILLPIVKKFSQGKYADNQSVQRMVEAVKDTVEYMADNVREYVSVSVELGGLKTHSRLGFEYTYMGINSIDINFKMFDFEMEMIQEKKNRVFEYAGMKDEDASFPKPLKYDKLGYTKKGPKVYKINSRPGIRKNWASSKKMYSLLKILEVGVSRSYTIEPVSSRYPNKSEKRTGQKGTIKLKYLVPFFALRGKRLFVGRMRHKSMKPKDKLNIITTKNIINTKVEKAFVAEINAYLRKDGVKKLLTDRVKDGIKSMKAFKTLTKMYIPGENNNTRLNSIKTIHRKKVVDNIK